MSQPFLDHTFYRSSIWPDLTITNTDEHVLIRTVDPMTVFSNALWQGGLTHASHFVNWKVPLDYRCADPVELMCTQIKAWGYPIGRTVGLQTAARLTHASIQEEAGDKYRLICCVTAGTGNAARAGRARTTFSAYACGTINTFVLIDASMTTSAMINAVITATEAKAAALQDLGVTEEAGEIATGTTTDAVVLASSQNKQYGDPHQFAGVATTIGNAIGRLVYQAVYEAVVTQKEG